MCYNNTIHIYIHIYIEGKINILRNKGNKESEIKECENNKKDSEPVTI